MVSRFWERLFSTLTTEGFEKVPFVGLYSPLKYLWFSRIWRGIWEIKDSCWLPKFSHWLTSALNHLFILQHNRVFLHWSIFVRKINPISWMLLVEQQPIFLNRMLIVVFFVILAFNGWDMSPALDFLKEYSMPIKSDTYSKAHFIT